ncbi:MAG: hypothetical protein WBH86_01870, partial [Thermogutta sp.]
TNSLVPLYARGVGAERFAAFVRGEDAQAAQVWGISGKYVDNTDVARILRSVILGQPVTAHHHAMAP